MTERPEPGKITRVDSTRGGGVSSDSPDSGAVFSEDAWQVAGRGDTATAIVSSLIANREKMASTLHYKLCKMRDELDYAARRLEEGDRRHVVARNNWYADLPIQIEQLQQQQEVIEDAVQLVRYASKVTPVSTSFALAQAADALESLDADRHAARLAAVVAANPDYDPSVAKMPSNTLVATLREQAASIRQVHEQNTRREADARQAERDAAKAKRLARPLGEGEKRALNLLMGGPRQMPYRSSGREAKAFSSLVERGMAERVEHADVPRGMFTLTVAGRQAQLALVTRD